MKIPYLKRIPGSGIPKGALSMLIFLILYCLIRGLYYYYNHSEIRYIAKKDWIPFEQEVFKADSTEASHEIAISTIDPMSVDESTLTKAGLKSYLAKRWIKFRNSGGKFRSRNDILKLYGIDTHWVASMKFEFKPVDESQHRTEHKDKKIMSHPKQKKDEPIDLNRADSESLLKLPGIGPVITHRIISFREHLGGFTNTQQVFKVYGLEGKESMLMGKFFLGPIIRKIRVNTDSEEQLAYHPYISKKLAGLICMYRKQHQKIQTFDDLRKLPVMNDSLLAKLQPYITFEILSQ